jgi:hypothetical protein
MAAMNSPFHRWERRRAPRFTVEQLVSLTFRNTTPQQATGTCTDVSTSGMYCVVDVKVASGEKLEFLLNLPSESMLVQPVRLRGSGHVVRVHHDAQSRQYGLGISFDEVSVAAQQ